MDTELKNILDNLTWWHLIALGLFFAYIITYFSIPSIVSVSKRILIFEKTKSRSSHVGSVPTLGGIAIFAGFVIAGGIFLPRALLGQYRFVIGALVILFFAGVKDDLQGLAPRKKLVLQIIVALIIAVLGNIRISSFHGLLLG